MRNMVINSKDKGSHFEGQVAKILGEKIKYSKFKRVPGSGAMGTAMGESLLCGDVVGEVEHFPKKFRLEVKTGYNTSKNKEVKQFTLKKEWLDKIAEEAENTYSIPAVVGHFDGARSGVKNFVVLDVEWFVELINWQTELQRELDLLYDKVEQDKIRPK